MYTLHTLRITWSKLSTCTKHKLNNLETYFFYAGNFDAEEQDDYNDFLNMFNWSNLQKCVSKTAFESMF